MEDKRLTILTEQDFKNGKLHNEFDIEIQVKGMRVKAVNGKEIQGMLNKLLNSNEEKRLDINRLEEPNVWYF